MYKYTQLFNAITTVSLSELKDSPREYILTDQVGYKEGLDYTDVQASSLSSDFPSLCLVPPPSLSMGLLPWPSNWSLYFHSCPPPGHSPHRKQRKIFKIRNYPKPTLSFPCSLYSHGSSLILNKNKDKMQESGLLEILQTFQTHKPRAGHLLSQVDPAGSSASSVCVNS